MVQEFTLVSPFALAGDQPKATEALARVDRDLASWPLQGGSLKHAVRARASVLALTEILDQHAAYFCAGAPQ